MSEHIRNVAIIAHVDHGKTTLVDKLLQTSGAFRANQALAERAMDSMDLEREKGITIKSKNTAVRWGDRLLNIVDTPGHADFGGEVERVMKMVDGALLVVDAFEGPQAQTRFVLRKALQEGLRLIIVINKIDRPNADPNAVREKVLELLLDLEANDEQFHAPVFYGSARDGYFSADLENPGNSVAPLMDAIFDSVPSPAVEAGKPFRMLVSNIDWDDYVGRVAIGRVLSGEVKRGDNIWRILRDGERQRATVTKVFEYSALATVDSASGGAGNIVGVAGFEDADIGETLSADAEAEALPFVAIDPPTVQMQFAINDGPFAGREGKYVTSRQIRDRLFRAAKTNVSLKVEDTDTAGVFAVSARGAMQIAVLVEEMRREGYEVLVSRPMVIMQRDDDGKLVEPYESLFIEVPEEFSAGVLKMLASRRGNLVHMESTAHGQAIEAVIPTRGIIGLEFELMNLTSGHGVMSHLSKEYGPHAGEIATRTSGTLVSMETGPATAYSLFALEERGKLFVGAAEDVCKASSSARTRAPTTCRSTRPRKST
ncbi:MAG: GTP-binding protein [Verrucomicrobiales bacterium]